MNNQARAFCFTWNYPYSLPTEHDLPDCTHLVYQEEMGEESGIPHLQGYAKFIKRIRGRQFKDMFTHAYTDADHIHIDVARGTPQDNLTYCTKVGTRLTPADDPYIFGEFGPAQGKRKDLLHLRDAIVERKPLEFILTDDLVAPVAARHIPYLKLAMDTFNKPPQRDGIHVRLCLGPAGCGKTHCATRLTADQTVDDIYFKDGSDFWEGYTGQPIVILDEFGGHAMQPLIFNRVCDKYPYTVPKKGTSFPLSTTDFRITSNYTPSGWWSSKTHYQQEAVYRRIHEVHYHDKRGHYFRYQHRVEEDGSTTYAMDLFLAANHYMPAPRMGTGNVNN